METLVLVMPMLVFPKILFLSPLAWPQYSLINCNNLDCYRLKINGEKTYNGIYDDLVLSVFDKILT